jgi:hypothetical protein
MTRLDEPVERYFRNAIRDDAERGRGVRLTMSGRIKVGTWLHFKGVEMCDGRSFVWQARVAGGLLVVTDRFDLEAGSTEGRLFGRMRLFRSADVDTTRSAAGRAALEAIWTPRSLLPENGVTWRADSDELIVASWDVPPERPELHLRIDDGGAVLSAWAQRWRGDAGYVPCGCEVHEHRRWGDLVVPSRVTVGWDFGTPAYRPFFSAHVEGLAENWPRPTPPRSHGRQPDPRGQR